MDDSSIKPPPDTTTSNLKIHTAIALVLFAFTFLLFLQARHFDFINVDDPQYVADNPHVRSGLSPANIGWAFTALRMANWHPLTWISHMIDVTLFGLDPAGHHLTSVFIHAINGALLYLALVSMTRATWKSAIVAALFALHPLRMESVAWIAERKDVLCGLFFFLALGCYAKYARTGRWSWYAATAGAFALGLMSKPMVVTLPCVLLLLDFWPLRRTDSTSIGRLVLEKIPLLVLSLASAVVTYIAQQRGGATRAGEHLSLAVRLGNAALAYVGYVGKTLWPSDLAAYYPYFNGGAVDTFPWGKVAATAVLLLAITAIALLLWRRERATLVGWLWFLGMLVPTIGFVQVGMQSMADRYTYLPQIGLLIAIVWGLGALGEQRRSIAGLLKIAAVAAIAICAGCTAYQLRYWQNSATLFSHALSVTNANSFASMSVAMYLSEHGDNDRAYPFYIESLRIDPKNAEAHMNLANVLASRGQTKAALEHVQTAIALAPNSPNAQNNLANILVQMGRPEEAIPHHQKAIELDPELAQAHYNYGVTLAQLGRMAEAKEQLTEALRLRPDYPNARYAYGLALMMDHNIPAATEQFEIALRQLSDSGRDRALQAQIEARLNMLRSSLPSTNPVP